MHVECQIYHFSSFRYKLLPIDMAFIALDNLVLFYLNYITLHYAYRIPPYSRGIDILSATTDSHKLSRFNKKKKEGLKIMTEESDSFMKTTG